VGYHFILLSRPLPAVLSIDNKFGQNIYPLNRNLVAGVKDESGKKDLRKKAEEYLKRAEQIKELIKNQDG
jgi:hypothetical protein